MLKYFQVWPVGALSSWFLVTHSHYLEHFLTFQYNRFHNHFVFIFPSPEISHFAKKPGFLLVGNGISTLRYAVEVSAS